MKKFAVIIITLLSAISCTNLDEVWAELRDHEERIQRLEALCNKLNSNVEAIQTILTALEQNDYVTDIVKVMEDGVEVGYSITFAKGGTVTIYHGSDGADGAAPKVSIRKAQDGEYYWTADGEWMTDENGEMIPAVVADDPNGEYITPQFRVADGKWYVSYDNGNTWRAIDQKNDGENFFQNVTYDQDYVYITLADGNIFKIPYKTDSKVVDLFIFMGQSNMSGRGVAAKAPKVPEGWGFEYKAISDPGKLLHMVEPFGLDEDNAASGVDDSNGTNGTKRKGSSVSALTIAYYEKTGVPVVGVSCSKGGSSTTFWMPGTKPLNDAIARQLEAEQWLADNGYTIRNNYMFWLQGESDRSMAPETYKSNLVAIVKEMIEKTGVTNCMMLRVGQSDTSTATTKNNIIEVQTELCQTYTEFVMASTLTAGFPDDGLMQDTWHYTQEGYDILGTDAGKNVAFYVNNGIEPTMYDPYYQGLYYPISKYKSIFDIDPETPNASTDGIWYVNSASTSHGSECAKSNVSNGWIYSHPDDVAAIRGVPINAVQFATTSTSGTVTVGVIEEFGATHVSKVYTGTFTKSSTKKEIVTVRLSSTFTLSENQHLVFEPSTVAPTRNYNFYFGTAAGNLEFYSRAPINQENGSTYPAYRHNTGSSIGWNVGYIMPEPGTQEDIVIPSDGVMTKDMFVRLKDSWLADGSSNIVIGNDKGYHMCYLPVDVSGYSSISVTANDDHNAYFQFFKDDNLNGLCGTRIIVEKGKTMVFEIPSGAKYLVMSHSRTNLTDVADGYGLYFPAALRIFKTTAEASTGPWAGKKMVVIGDSITAGSHHGESPIWYQALASEIGITNVVASGQSGSAISTTSYYGTDYGPMVVRYENLPADGDLYIVFGGTNDYTLSTPLGTMNDVTDVSFYGALDVMINGLKKKVPDATVVFLTPINRYGYGQTRVGKIKLITPYTKNDEGHDLYDYRKAIMDKCEQYSVPVIDVFLFPEFDFSQGQDGVSTFNSSATNAHPWTNDGLHPNHLGHPALGKVLVPYINRIWVDAAFPGGNEDINNSEGEW